MPRGRFKSLAVFSLITALIAGPMMAASPGDASRRAAARGTAARQGSSSTSQLSPASGVQNALGLRPFDQRGSVQQVVGKQPTASKVDPNRSFSLLPNLFGTSGSAQQSGPQRTSQTTRSQTTRSQTTRSQRTGSQQTTRSQPSQTRSQSTNRSAQSPVNSKGILSDLFGTRTSSEPRAAARPIDKPAPKVDWEGIPYHQARSKTAARIKTPIRDPQPGEARMAGPSSSATRPSATRTAVSTPSINPAVPKPPALAKAPSTRRSTTSKAVSSRVNRTEAVALSPLSSSRRSGRRDVPTLDASEIAAAQSKSVPKEQLVPKVARRNVQPESKPSAKDIASAPKRDSKNIKAGSAAKDPVKKTPSAEVAVNPQPKLKPAPKAITLTEDKEAIAASPKPAQPATSTRPTTPKPAAAAPLASSVAGGQSATPIQRPATTPEQQAKTPPAPSQLPSAIAGTTPNTPQFVAPRLPVPATPTFGTPASVAGHRIGPPTGSFQPRTRPRAALNPPNAAFGPAGTPIGSGIASHAADTATALPTAATPLPPTPKPLPTAPGIVTPSTPAPIAGAPNHPAPYNPAPYNPGPNNTTPYNAFAQPHPSGTPAIASPPQRLAQNPYQPMRDPYATPAAPQPNASAHGSSLGTPLTSTPAATGTPATLPAPTQPQYTNQAEPPRFEERPFQAPPRPRSVATRTTNELPPGQTAVASELPGIRVITHGPSSVIIRQTHEFEIRVENRGSIDASGVMVRAVVPDWADVKGQTTSRGEVENQTAEESDRLVWTLDSLPAGATEKLFVRLQALESGTHALDVDWTLIPQKSVARIEVREPKLDLVIEGPEEVVYGESQTYKVRVLNPGDGVAPNVVFTLSPNSPTPQTQRIGNIPSGKEAQFEVELTAQDLGDLKIHGLASGDLGLKAQAQKSIRVSAAELEAVLAGPEMKYQNTDAMYHLQVTNKGNATSKNVTASLALPPGIRYKGGIDTAKKRGTKLTWEIGSLPPGATREYEFDCVMLSPGKQTFDFAASGTAAGKTSVALDTLVESIADLVMTIQDPAAPAPVGSEVIYEIVIKNRGSRQAQGVRAIAQFSKGIEPRRIEGHSGQVLTGQVLFDPIEAIRPGEEVRIRVIAEAETEGHHRFRTEIRSGETVLVAEEATQYLNKRGERVSRRSSSSAR